MSTPPKPDLDGFEQRVQVVVRAVLAVVLVGAYIGFKALGVSTDEFFTGLVGLAAGFFVGGAVAARK